MLHGHVNVKYYYILGLDYILLRYLINSARMLMLCNYS